MKKLNISKFLEQLIELYKEYCVFVAGTELCEANSIGDFIGWLIRYRSKKDYKDIYGKN